MSRPRLFSLIVSCAIGAATLPVHAMTMTEGGFDPSATIYGGVRLTNFYRSGEAGRPEVIAYGENGHVMAVGDVSWDTDASHVGKTTNRNNWAISYDGNRIRAGAQSVVGKFGLLSIDVPFVAPGPVNYADIRVIKASPKAFLDNGWTLTIGGGRESDSFAGVTSESTTGRGWMFTNFTTDTLGVIGTFTVAPGGGGAPMARSTLEIRFGHVAAADARAPVVSNIDVALPAHANGTASASARVSEVAAGGRKIVSAQYSLNGSDWTPMAAADGAFDSATETATASFVASRAGENTICVRGTDEAGTVGRQICSLFEAGHHGNAVAKAVATK